MKLITLYIATAAVLGAFVLPGTASAQNQRTDIAFINLDSVFTNYNKTKLAEAQLKEQAEEVKEDRQELIADIKAAREVYKALQAQAKSPALNDNARAEKLAEAEEALLEVKGLESQLGRLEESARRKFEEQSRRARKRLVEEINVLLEQYATEKELTAVIDTSGESLNGVPTIVYYRPELDITAAIIERLNK